MSMDILKKVPFTHGPREKSTPSLAMTHRPLLSGGISSKAETSKAVQFLIAFLNAHHYRDHHSSNPHVNAFSNTGPRDHDLDLITKF
jgi:hypothetical protein